MKIKAKDIKQREKKNRRRRANMKKGKMVFTLEFS